MGAVRGEATCSLGEATVSLGEATVSLGDATCCPLLPFMEVFCGLADEVPILGTTGADRVILGGGGRLTGLGISLRGDMGGFEEMAGLFGVRGDIGALGDAGDSEGPFPFREIGEALMGPLLV